MLRGPRVEVVNLGTSQKGEKVVVQEAQDVEAFEKKQGSGSLGGPVRPSFRETFPSRRYEISSGICFMAGDI